MKGDKTFRKDSKNLIYNNRSSKRAKNRENRRQESIKNIIEDISSVPKVTNFQIKRAHRTPKQWMKIDLHKAYHCEISEPGTGKIPKVSRYKKKSRTKHQKIIQTLQARKMERSFLTTERLFPMYHQNRAKL